MFDETAMRQVSLGTPAGTFATFIADELATAGDRFRNEPAGRAGPKRPRGARGLTEG